MMSKKGTALGVTRGEREAGKQESIYIIKLLREIEIKTGFMLA